MIGTAGEQPGDLTAVDAAGCARMFADFARSASPRAPFYSRLSARIAGEEPLAGLLLLSPPRQRQPVLLLACVHMLLLGPAGHDAALARYYPNLTPEPLDGDPLPALREFCAEHRGRLAELLATRSTQTNEIGRCSLLVPVLGLLSDEVGPLAHLDVGASAGLNLQLHRYRYTYSPGGVVGDPSPVTFECTTRGEVPVPDALPDIRQRIGLDRAPVDVGDPEQRRWLEACVWPDQTDRFVRLRATLAIAAATPPVVLTGDAVTDTAALAASVRDHPVITTTWVLSYLSGEQRTTFIEALDTRAEDIDMSWVFAESPPLVPELPIADRTKAHTAVGLVRWHGGRRHVDHLADAHPHGYWLHWR